MTCSNMSFCTFSITFRILHEVPGKLHSSFYVHAYQWPEASPPSLYVDFLFTPKIAGKKLEFTPKIAGKKLGFTPKIAGKKLEFRIYGLVFIIYNSW